MIEFSDHAIDNMRARGATEDEVRWLIENGRESDAMPPRLAREATFTEGFDWKERFYPHKLVKVIYVFDGDRIVIITVFAFYGRWEAER